MYPNMQFLRKYLMYTGLSTKVYHQEKNILISHVHKHTIQHQGHMSSKVQWKTHRLPHAVSKHTRLFLNQPEEKAKINHIT